MYGVSEDELSRNRLASPKQVVNTLWWIGEDCRICTGARGAPVMGECQEGFSSSGWPSSTLPATYCGCRPLIHGVHVIVRHMNDRGTNRRQCI